ncbi:hypothetical protein GCM10010398_67510 [Streptomyces fimbriatus]
MQALECRGLSGAVEAELRRLVVEARTFSRKDAAQELWRKLAAYAADVPERGLPRDAEQARITLLSEAERYPAMVTPDPAAAEAMDRELEPAKRAVAERLIRDGGEPGLVLG